MKKFISFFLVAVMLFGCMDVFAEEKVNKERLSMDEITFGEPVNYGNVLFNTNLVRGCSTIQDGEPIGLTVVPGAPSLLNIVNLNRMELIEAIELPQTTSTAWHMTTDSFGNVWFGSYTKCRLFKYSPADKKLYDCGRILSEGAMVGITVDDEDNIWMGTMPSAKIVKYDVKGEKFIDMGSMTSEDQYTIGVSWYDGKLYFQHNTSKALYVYDTKTGEKSEIPFDDPSYGGSSKLQIVGDFLIMNGNPMKIFDLKNQVWYDSVSGTKGEYVTPLYGDIFYFMKDGYAHSYNIRTKEMIKLEGLPYGSYFRGAGVLFEVDDLEMPGLNYFNIQYSGRIQVWNFETQKMKDVNGLLQGVASETRSYGFGPDGRFYDTEYMGTKAAAVDLKTGKVEFFHMAQPESFTTLGDKMYFGNYEGAELYILDTTKPYFQVSDPQNPENNPRIWGFMGEEQSRPFVSLATEDKVVFGSVPGYGEFGGAISIYDPETDTVDSYRHLVKDQMPVSLAYKDGLLYAGTSVSGGLGILPEETDAKVFIFDMEKREVVKCVDMKIPGVTADIKGVEGISIAPDNTLVGYGRGYLYKMDMETLELIDYRVWGDVNYGNGQQIWKPYSVIYDKSGYAFMSFDGKLAIVDYETLDYKITDADMSYLAVMGEDGNIYQKGDGYKNTMLPVVRGEDYSYKFLGKILFKPGYNNAVVGGEVKKIDENPQVAPYRLNSRIMIPLRFLAENLGFSVTYDEMEKSAIAYNSDTKIILKAGSRDVYINGEYKKLVAPPEIRNDRLFVHSRTFAEIFGKAVYWDESDLVVINADGSEFDASKDKDVIKYAEDYLKGGSND